MIEAKGSHRLAQWLLLAALAAHLPTALSETSAANTQLLSQQFVYKASEKKLAEALQDFAASQSIPIVLAEGIEGSLTGSFELGARSFLKLVSDSYGLTWYHDGTALFVYPVKSLQSKLFYLSGVDFANIHFTLESLGLADARFPLRHASERGLMFAFGPPRYIELISAVIDSLSAQARDPARTAVRMFPLKHAHAATRTVAGAQRLGVAELLRRLYGTERGPAGLPDLDGITAAKLWPSLAPQLSGGKGEGAGLRPVQEASGKNMDVMRRTLVTGGSSSAQVPTDRAALDTSAAIQAMAPVIEADEARNSVIVRARPEQFKEIETLVRQFDVPQDVVELEAVIIDVNHSDVRDLGLRWEAAALGATVNFGGPVTGVANDHNFSLTRLAAGRGLQFMVDINALQAKGRARIVARPRVLGIANQPAVMKDSRTASVRVAGNLATSLHQVEAGTRIEMLARRVGPVHEKKLLLSISIQDGAFDDQSVDTVPIVRQTEIHTETYVDDGEALLIGGISTERNSSSESGVPGLSTLPVVGGLFTTKRRHEATTERLFLIVPRAVGTSLATQENEETKP